MAKFLGSWSSRELRVRAPAEMKKSSNSASRWKRKGMIAVATEARRQECRERCRQERNVRGEARAGLGSQFENRFGLKEAVDEVMARPRCSS